MIVRSYDGPGTAEVIERQTGERLGYALQNFHGHWVAHPNFTGEPLVTLGTFRTRRDAADLIWDLYA